MTTDGVEMASPAYHPKLTHARSSVFPTSPCDCPICPLTCPQYHTPEQPWKYRKPHRTCLTYPHICGLSRIPFSTRRKASSVSCQGSYKAELRATDAYGLDFVDPSRAYSHTVIQCTLHAECSVDFFVNQSSCNCTDHRRGPMTIASTSARRRGPREAYIG